MSSPMLSRTITTFRSVMVCVFVAVSLLLGSPHATAAEMDPTQALEQGFALLQADRLEEAERAFLYVLRHQPDKREARFGLGTIYITQNRYQEAKDSLERLHAENPGEFTVLNNLAWLYATATDLSVRDGRRAVELAQEALLIQPNNFNVWNTLSEGHYVTGDYERAARAAQEAIRVARQSRAAPDRIRQYEEQLEKCRQAQEAQSLLE